MVGDAVLTTAVDVGTVTVVVDIRVVGFTVSGVLAATLSIVEMPMLLDEFMLVMRVTDPALAVMSVLLGSFVLALSSIPVVISALPCASVMAWVALGIMSVPPDASVLVWSVTLIVTSELSDVSLLTWSSTLLVMSVRVLGVFELVWSSTLKATSMMLDVPLSLGRLLMVETSEVDAMSKV